MPKVRQTFADYEHLPEHVRADFLGGEVVVAATPTFRHEQLLMRFVEALAALLGPGWGRRVFVSRYEIRAGSGDDEEAAQPDVAVLAEGAEPPPGRTRPTPFLVAEILSPSTARHDRGAKLQFYGRAGVLEAWILDPVARAIEVHGLVAMEKRIFASGQIAESRALPGFRVDVAAFFAA
jgi:Uma2 family endonuclease